MCSEIERKIRVTICIVRRIAKCSFALLMVVDSKRGIHKLCRFVAPFFLRDTSQLASGLFQGRQIHRSIEWPLEKFDQRKERKEGKRRGRKKKKALANEFESRLSSLILLLIVLSSFLK